MSNQDWWKQQLTRKSTNPPPLPNPVLINPPLLPRVSAPTGGPHTQLHARGVTADDRRMLKSLRITP